MKRLWSDQNRFIGIDLVGQTGIIAALK